MKQVQASEAKTHLPALLDEVERGETIVITRHGRAIARIVPEKERRREQTESAFAEIDRIRQRTGRMTVAEILAARDEGRR
jgi:prevent-host-death family protein